MSVKRQGIKRGIYLIPNLLTTGNMFSGFYSVIASLGGEYIYAAVAILIAVVFDGLDGKVARMTKMATNFGGQLDSLCDAISFGLSPAFLTLALLKATDAPFPSRFLQVICGLYMVCTILRLARFNVENSPDESSHEWFKGIPSPAAAGVVAGFVLLYSSFLQDKMPDAARIVVKVLPFAVLSVALLMVSQVRYTHVVNRAFGRHRTFAQLAELVLAVLLLAALVVIHPEGGLLGGFLVYALSGPVMYLKGVLTHRPEPEPLPRPEEPHP